MDRSETRATIYKEARIAINNTSRTVCLIMGIVGRISTLLIIYACIDGDLLCNGAANCTDRSDEDSKLCSRIGWPPSLQMVRPLTEMIRPSIVQNPRRIRSPVTPSPHTCKAPPQPQNGQWKLHRSQCSNGQECNATEGTELGLGSLLVYSCNSGYKIKGSRHVSCIVGGKWMNIPECVRVCGTLPPDDLPIWARPNITEFPWHASLYRNVDGQKRFFCGATLMQGNLLITAAHCVYDEETKKPLHPKSIYVLTGNTYRDYDHPSHDEYVKKNQVKRIYIRSNYLGHLGKYRLDIAILELLRPFILSTWLVPICIDTSSDNNVLHVGAEGKVAGFGGTGESNAVLQSRTVPVVLRNHCGTASQYFYTEQYITNDKFCASITNGSSICDGDSGGGLVFETDGLWYLCGIVSVSLGMSVDSDGNFRCENAYSFFTKVSTHISWIQDVVSKIEQNQIQMLCSTESQTNCSFADNKYSNLRALGFF